MALVLVAAIVQCEMLVESGNEITSDDHDSSSLNSVLLRAYFNYPESPPIVQFIDFQKVENSNSLGLVKSCLSQRYGVDRSRRANGTKHNEFGFCTW